MTRAKIADALRRAVRTFVQSGAAYLMLNPGHDTGRALAVGAAGAGLAAVWRLVDPPDPTPETTLDAVPPVKAGTSAGKL